MESWSLGEIIGGALVFLATVAGVARAGVEWAFRAKEKAQAEKDKAAKGRVDHVESDLHDKARKWELEMSGIKDAMAVKEREAREGRTVLHERVDRLDEKMQRDYARIDTIDEIRGRMERIEVKIDRLIGMK